MVFSLSPIPVIYYRSRAAKCPTVERNWHLCFSEGYFRGLAENGEGHSFATNSTCAIPRLEEIIKLFDLPTESSSVLFLPKYPMRTHDKFLNGCVANVDGYVISGDRYKSVRGDVGKVIDEYPGNVLLVDTGLFAVQNLLNAKGHFFNTIRYDWNSFVPIPE
ncbi:hypothetical protein HYU11_02120 [Candidatus Woesearchaeota archaeon]|nr:hypothetical protein [Candidatus Woesearchaeota archaeon]